MTEFDYLSGGAALLQNVFAHHAAASPDRTWCVFEGADHSYGEIDADANRLAHALRGFSHDPQAPRRGGRLHLRQRCVQ